MTSWENFQVLMQNFIKITRISQIHNKVYFVLSVENIQSTKLYFAIINSL